MGFNVHSDGVFAEGATPIATSGAEFMTSVMRMQHVLSQEMEADVVGVDCLDLRPVVAQFKEHCPFLNKERRVHGCDRDMLDGQWRTVPKYVPNIPLKESGFHIHMTLRPDIIDDYTALSDVAQGFYEETKVLHTELESPWPAYYRVPGVFRPKPYGIEYRALGASIANDIDKLTFVASAIERFLTKHFTDAGRVYA
jgi:hypothetical protein